MFGSDHVGAARLGEVYDAGVWRTPLGEVAIDEELAAGLAGASEQLEANPRAHGQEHSLEVQVPLIQLSMPGAKIVPITVPPAPLAVQIGRAVGEALAARTGNVTVLGSTDLTHHGGHFGHWGGRHEEGAAWTEKNDRRMIDLIEAMKADDVVPEATANRNACGAGAIAATIAACHRMGATRGRCLGYTNSYRITHERYPAELDDTTVGYASVVFA
jgi:AmmeMemoRadiSam system protein B